MSTTATLPGFRPVLFPGPVWALLELVGLCAGTVLGFLVAEASYGSRAVLRSWGAGEVAPRTIVILFIWLSGLGLVLYGLFVQGRSSTATCGRWPLPPPYCWPPKRSTRRPSLSPLLPTSPCRPPSPTLGRTCRVWRKA